MSYLYTEERILMVKKKIRKNDPNSGLFTLPGGKLKDFEKGLNVMGRLKSAVRETEEETGLTLIDPVLRGVIIFDNSKRIFDNWSNPEDFLVYMCSATRYIGRLKSETEEGKLFWVKEHDISKIPKNIGDERIYEWLKDSRYFIGTVKYKEKLLDEGGTFVDYFD